MLVFVFPQDQRPVAAFNRLVEVTFQRLLTDFGVAA
jgi:hypothetical protein